MDTIGVKINQHFSSKLKYTFLQITNFSRNRKNSINIVFFSPGRFETCDDLERSRPKFDLRSRSRRGQGHPNRSMLRIIQCVLARRVVWGHAQGVTHLSQKLLAKKCIIVTHMIKQWLWVGTFLLITFGKNELQQCAWSQTILLATTRRMIYSIVLFGRHWSRRDLDRRSNFGRDLSRSSYTSFEASRREKYGGDTILSVGW